MPIVLGHASIRTPRDLIELALKDSGVYGVAQTPLAEDSNDAFNRCNMMLAQWSVKRWLVYQLIDTAVTATGATSYTVGIGYDFNITRPDRIEAAYFRQISPITNQPDTPLSILQSREDYSRISLKGLQSFPQYVFYDPGFPTGTIYFWPVPSNVYEMHILTKAVLSQFSSMSQVINLPSEYLAAIFYNLCVRLRPAYEKGPDPTLTAMARDALAVIRASNTQIPRLKMPSGLNNRGAYDVYGDNNG